MAVGTVPGFMSHSKSEVDGKIQNLSNKTIPELLDLRDRQQKLLNNKAFIRKLPDKGAKIQALYDKICVEIKAKEEEEQTCNLFSAMKLNGVDKDSVQSIEWQGKLDKNLNTYLDSDDDSEPEDVLHILSKSVVKEKQVKVLQPDKPLITAQDLLDIGEVAYVKKLVEKTEIKSKPKLNGNFKPYKLPGSEEQNPEKEISRTRKKHWELTAATPPPFLHSPAKILNIEESLKLQAEYNKHIKEIEAKHAAERLLSLRGLKMPELPQDTTKFGKYRNVDSDDNNSDDSDPEGSDKEVHDDEPERGGVIFTVMK